MKQINRFIALLLCLIVVFGGVDMFFTASAEDINDAPIVIPAVREWQGDTGKFLLSDGMKVVLEKVGLISEAQKKVITEYFSTVAGLDVTVSVGLPQSGDVYLRGSVDNSLGDEGYTLVAADTVEISARTGKALIYGIITLLQSYVAEGNMPRGTVRDYPSYPIRSGMIDVARAYIPLEYVEEITKYFAWFKMNEIHLHINDRGSDGKGYFRLESDVPGLTSDEHYTKAEYRDYQKRMQAYGVEIVTEIDTPAHCTAFFDAVPQYMFDSYHIDITNPEAVKFICDVWDEYITGVDPVFVGKTVHFGTDEFTSGYNEEMRAYTDTLLKHIRSRGYTPRFWGSFGGDGFNGNTPVSGEAQTNFWAVSLSDYKTLFNMGYDVINSCGPVLYCVPGGNYGFADYYDLTRLYKTWFVNYMGNSEATSVAYNNPQLKGASFCLWNDLWCNWGGFSVFDIFDRLRYQVCLISEKTWCGEQTRKITAENFISRFDTLSLKAGGSNPGRHEELPITLENASGIKSVGFPYCMTAEITVSDYGCDILSGADGSLYVERNGKLKLKREGYSFDFGYTVKRDEPTTLTLYADNRRTLLIVDGTWYYDASNPRNPAQTFSTTFVLPLEKIGSEGCVVSSLTVKKPDFDPNDMLCQSNLALGKTAVASGLEVDYLHEALALDGNDGTRLSFARDKDEQWLVADIGSVRKLSKVIIKFFERVSAYEIYVSQDGESYQKVYEISGLPDGVKADDEIEFEPVDARYIKYVQVKRWYCAPYSTWYSGGIREFEVYGAPPDCSDIIAEAETIDDSTVKTALRNLKYYMRGKSIYESHLIGLRTLLENAVEEYNNPPEEPSEVPSEAPSESSSEEPSAEISSESSASEETEEKSNSLVPIIVGAAVVAIAAIAAGIYLAIKKRKNK